MVMEEKEGQFLTSQQEVAEALGMHAKTLERYLQRYPFVESGAPGKVNGRWRVRRAYVLVWWEYVQRQESRHPEARRYRPEEPPALEEIKGR